MRKVLAFGVMLCAPILLFVVWYGLHAIRADFGLSGMAIAGIGSIIGLGSFAFLVDSQAERLHQQWLDQHGLRRLEK